MEILWKSTVRRLFTKQKHIFKNNYRYYFFLMHTITHERGLQLESLKYIKKIRLCLGVGFEGFILKKKNYMVHILYGVI